MIRRALCAALCAAWAGPLFAAHPYLTDDTGTQGTGHWQLELIAERHRNDHSADTGSGAVREVRALTLFSPVLTYGALETVDVAFSASHLRQHATQDGSVSQASDGLSDSTLELKWRFYEENRTSMALKPGVVLPTGDEERGLGTGKLSWGVNFIVAHQLEPWTFLVNVAYARARYKRPEDTEANRPHLWRASAGVGYSVREDLRLVGEAGSRTNGATDDPFLPGRNGHFVMLGLIYSPSDDVDLDIGVRKSHKHRAEFDTAVLLGATFRW